MVKNWYTQFLIIKWCQQCFVSNKLLGAWALEKSLMRPSFFLYLQEIRKKRRHWYGCQSALRLYNRHNLCPCARPAHMGESEPCGREQAWVQVLQNSGCCGKSDGHVKIYNCVSARSPLTKSTERVSVHWRPQCHAKWQRHQELNPSSQNHCNSP